MTDILKCDLCNKDAGNDPYHATVNGNGHVHICHDCFDPQQHDVGVLKQQRDELLVALQYWLPKELPFPHQPNDPFCQGHNKQWSSARAAIAKAGGSLNEPN